MKSKVLLVLLTTGALVYFLYLAQLKQPQVNVGDTAPVFQLSSKERSYRLEEFRGKTVLLNFWATWCPPCREEMPSLDALHRSLSQKDFVVVAVSLDEDGWKPIDRFRVQFPVSFPILLDAKGDVAAEYGTYQLPESYLIDRDGVVVQKYIGPRHWMDPKLVTEILKYVKAP